MRDDDAAKVKAARECPVAACGRGHQETGPTSQEPKACWEAKLFQEDSVSVGRKMGRVNVHKTSASRESSAWRIDGQTDRLQTHVYRFLIKSLWYRCVACGWRRENPGGNELGTSKLGFCIAYVAQQPIAS